MSHLFSPLTLRSVEIPNRIVMSPMCMYSSTDGIPGDWHKVHLASRAFGGAGMVVMEVAGVSPIGRITPGDVGIWSDAHAEALKPITELISSAGAVPAIQIGHAGRKAGRTIPWEGNTPIPLAEWGELLGPSAIPYQSDWNTPQEMDEATIEKVVAQFGAAARHACDAGFKVIEAHLAHGYLLHEFFSPLSNRRTDAFGGSLENRARFSVMAIRAMREAMPDGMPLIARLSVVDWAEGGITLEDSIELVKMLKAEGVDMIDCSSGAVVPGETVPEAPGYHVPFARAIREKADIATAAVGMIREAEQAEQIIAEGSADLVFLARAMLKDAYWARKAAVTLGAENAVPLPIQYKRAVEGMNRPPRR